MGITNDLERLAELHRSGALDDAEFASAKARAIGSAPRRGDGLLDGLHALRRSRSDRWLGGVCGGLAPATGLPAWVWRLIFVSLALCGGTGLMLYVLLWILLPKEDAEPRPRHRLVAFDLSVDTAPFDPLQPLGHRAVRAYNGAGRRMAKRFLGDR